MSVLAGPTTFEGIANSLKLAKDAVATPASTGPPKSGQSSAQDTGPASKDCSDAKQPDGNLESALSRLGGMLESAGPLIDQACSQLEVPAGQSLVSMLAAAWVWITHLLMAYQWFVRDTMQQRLHMQSWNQSASWHPMHHIFFPGRSCKLVYCLSVSVSQSLICQSLLCLSLLCLF